jgi:hypothetical protein
MAEVFLYNYRCDKRNLKFLIKKTEIKAPVVCMTCFKVYEIELYGSFLIGESGEDALAFVISPTHQHPFLCEGCLKGVQT